MSTRDYQDYIAGENVTLTIHATTKTVAISVYERYGDDDGPSYASITVTRETWERITREVETG